MFVSKKWFSGVEMKRMVRVSSCCLLVFFSACWRWEAKSCAAAKWCCVWWKKQAKKKGVVWCNGLLAASFLLAIFSYNSCQTLPSYKHHWLTDWLTDWLIHWLDWLTDYLDNSFFCHVNFPDVCSDYGLYCHDHQSLSPRRDSLLPL